MCEVGPGQARPGATQHSRLGDDLYPGNNGGVGIKCEHQASQDKYIENQATNTNGQTDFNWTLKAATIPAYQVHWLGHSNISQNPDKLLHV